MYWSLSGGHIKQQWYLKSSMREKGLDIDKLLLQAIITMLRTRTFVLLNLSLDLSVVMRANERRQNSFFLMDNARIVKEKKNIWKISIMNIEEFFIFFFVVSHSRQKSLKLKIYIIVISECCCNVAVTKNYFNYPFVSAKT